MTVNFNYKYFQLNHFLSICYFVCVIYSTNMSPIQFIYSISKIWHVSTVLVISLTVGTASIIHQILVKVTVKCVQNIDFIGQFLDESNTNTYCQGDFDSYGQKGDCSSHLCQGEHVTFSFTNGVTSEMNVVILVDGEKQWHLDNWSKNKMSQ